MRKMLLNLDLNKSLAVIMVEFYELIVPETHCFQQTIHSSFRDAMFSIVLTRSPARRIDLMMPLRFQ